MLHIQPRAYCEANGTILLLDRRQRILCLGFEREENTGQQLGEYRILTGIRISSVLVRIFRHIYRINDVITNAYSVLLCIYQYLQLILYQNTHAKSSNKEMGMVAFLTNK